MITKANFQAQGYFVNSNNQPVSEHVVGTHHLLNNNYYSHQDAVSGYAGLRDIKIIPGNDTVYLPYYQSQVASIRLPTTAPAFFVTANLAGCAVYIGQAAPSQLVVFHANSQKGSDQATMSVHPPSYQHPDAIKELDGLIESAKVSYPGIKIIAVLSKATYLSNVDALAKYGSDFLGGTTVAGWRTGQNWEFWYQNWGHVPGQPTRLLYARKFFG
jgi:hypothetical protein